MTFPSPSKKRSGFFHKRGNIVKKKISSYIKNITTVLVFAFC